MDHRWGAGYMIRGASRKEGKEHGTPKVKLKVNNLWERSKGRCARRDTQYIRQKFRLTRIFFYAFEKFTPTWHKEQYRLCDHRKSVFTFLKQNIHTCQYVNNCVVIEILSKTSKYIISFVYMCKSVDSLGLRVRISINDSLRVHCRNQRSLFYRSLISQLHYLLWNKWKLFCFLIITL